MNPGPYGEIPFRCQVWCACHCNLGTCGCHVSQEAKKK